MATLKPVVLKHQKKTDGTWNVKIRVTHGPSSAYIPTPYYVNSKQINKKYEITDNYTRAEVDTMTTELRRLLASLRYNVEKYTAAELARYLEKEMTSEKDFSLCILEYGRELAERKKKTGAVSTGKLYITVVNRLDLFVDIGKLPVEDITARFLQDFQQYLEREGLTDTGINLYMRTLRAIFNAARQEFNDEDRGQIKIPHYPFLKYKIPPASDSKKRALPLQTLRAIRDSEPVNKREILARDVFMLSFYLIGMNTIDLFNCAKIEGNRIVYERTKTKSRRKDKAKISIRIEPEARALVEKYRDKTGKRVFGFHNMYADRSTFNANINKGLKKIGALKNVNVTGLNTYFARHSWATIARNICKVSKDDVAVCLNHASHDHRVTDIYIEEDYSILDETNRKVIDQLSTYKLRIEITSLSHLSDN